MDILANLRSAFAKNRRRNVIAASAAALVVATAVGTATAITLTIDLPRTYESLVEIAIFLPATGPVYTVPPGKKLMITDIILTNTSATGPTFLDVFQGSSSGCTIVKDKIPAIVVPAQSTFVLSLTTGIYFGPGMVCFGQGGPGTEVAARGYLFQ